MNPPLPTVTRYYGVQALRGFAALFVVMYHATKLMHDRLDFSMQQLYAGAAGVDIFFAISGFVIVLSSAFSWHTEGSWAPFLWKRLTRIVPLYWILTGLKLVLLLMMPALAQHSVVTLWHSAASFLFIPAWNVNHEAMPLVVVGWTLSFEMLFYTLFALALALQLQPVVWLTAIFCALSFLGLYREPDWGAPATLIDPLLLEFVFGMWIGIATLKGKRLPISSATWLTPLMIVFLCATCQLPTQFCFAYRVIIWGVPGAILLASIIALEERWSELFGGLPKLLGDASYAIYLVHGFILPIVGILLAKLLWNGVTGMVLAFSLCVILSSMAGIALHFAVERPLMKWLQNIPGRRAALCTG